MSTIDPSFYQIQELNHLIGVYEKDKNRLKCDIVSLVRERKLLENELSRFEEENRNLEDKNEELRQVLDETKEELEIRRQRDNRFELMDL